MFFHNTYHIWKREVKGYLYTPIAYVFVGVFTLIMGYMFAKFLQSYFIYTQQSQFRMGQTVTIDRLAEAYYANMHVMLLFILPFFTMRLFSEEMRQNTFALLMTSPIRSWELTLAKFSAGATVLSAMLLMTSFCPIFLILYSAKGAGPDLGILFTSYLGLYLCGLCYIGVGLFWSTVTKSQMVAAMMTWANLLLLWLVGLGAGQGESVAQTVTKHLAVFEHFSKFLRGSVELQSLVYLVGLIFLTLFLSNRAIESRSWRS